MALAMVSGAVGSAGTVGVAAAALVEALAVAAVALGVLLGEALGAPDSFEVDPCVDLVGFCVAGLSGVITCSRSMADGGFKPGAR